MEEQSDGGVKWSFVCFGIKVRQSRQSKSNSLTGLDGQRGQHYRGRQDSAAPRALLYNPGRLESSLLIWRKETRYAVTVRHSQVAQTMHTSSLALRTEKFSHGVHPAQTGSWSIFLCLLHFEVLPQPMSQTLLSPAQTHAAITTLRKNNLKRIDTQTPTLSRHDWTREKAPSVVTDSPAV